MISAGLVQSSARAYTVFVIKPSDFKTDDTALVLVDHQVGTLTWAGELTPDERDQLKTWVTFIATFAKAAGMPIVLTSSLETEAQGLLLQEQDALPDEYAKRVKRTGVINAWEDDNFANAVRGTGKKNVIMGGLTTDVCLVPPALSAAAEGFNVIALTEISGACTKRGAENSIALLHQNGIATMTVTPMITALLGNYKNPASATFFQLNASLGIIGLLQAGNVL
jgi:nicotinamidase-related amidase